MNNITNAPKIPIEYFSWNRETKELYANGHDLYGIGTFDFDFRMPTIYIRIMGKTRNIVFCLYSSPGVITHLFRKPKENEFMYVNNNYPEFCVVIYK